MKQIELIHSLESLGWTITKDSVGDKIATFHLTDRIVSSIPRVQKLSSGFVLRMRETFSTEGFSKAISYISEEAPSYHSMKTKFGDDYRSSSFSFTDVERIASLTNEWASQQNIEFELKMKRNLPTNSAGILPLHHLGALALGQDTKVLGEYHEAFERGDRLDFVPYIQKSHIKRALAFAQKEVLNC